MSKSLMVSLLSKANTGSELMSVLEAITSEVVVDTQEDSVDVIVFE